MDPTNGARTMGIAARPARGAAAGRQEGLDLLRTVAVILVTAQHVLSLAGYGDWTSFRTFNLGQLAVAVFLGISAVLAVASDRPPVSWILQRFGKLFPAYWVTMGFCFVLVWASGYKSFDDLQFLSQMLGLGLFTHAHNLVNVPTWFISLLVVCYLAFFVAKLAPRLLWTNLLLLAGVALWIEWNGYPWPWIHLLTFFLASTLAVAVPRKHWGAMFAIGGGLLLLASRHSVAFAYTGVTVGAIGISSHVTSSTRVVRTVSKYSYEYYLVHGPCLVGMMGLFHDHMVLGILSGVALAAATAVMLHNTISWGVERLSGRCVDALAFFRRTQPRLESAEIRKQQDAAADPVEAG
jgi:peptidoglycan/LPS O-acetylase OafA/YrhL